MGFRDLLLICLPGCHIYLWSHDIFLHKTLVKSVVIIIAALFFLLLGHLEVKQCCTDLQLAQFFDFLPYPGPGHKHNTEGLARLFINFPSVHSFSTVSQVKQTPPLIPRPYCSSPSLPRNHNTPSPASPRDDFFTHGPFHSAPRVGLSCGHAVPALWLPRWPHSHCFSVACSRCELNWWTHSSTADHFNHNKQPGTFKMAADIFGRNLFLCLHSCGSETWIIYQASLTNLSHTVATHEC